MANRCVPLIDELAATFCNLSLREITAPGPATTAQARVRFINCGDDATSLQTISTGQSSQTRADHDDPRAGCDLCCTEQRCRQGQSGGGRRNRANKLTTRHGGIICGRVTPVGLGCCRRGVAKEFSKRCVRHNGIGVSRCDCIVLREAVQCGVSLCAPCGLWLILRKNLHDLLNRIPTASSGGHT